MPAPNDTCNTCVHFDDIDGRCCYRPPPIVLKIYAALQLEPATHIDWDKLCVEKPKVDHWFCCDAHKTRPDNG